MLFQWLFEGLFPHTYAVPPTDDEICVATTFAVLCQATWTDASKATDIGFLNNHQILTHALRLVG